MELLSKIKTALKSVVVVMPALVGCLAPFRIQSPRGPTLIDDLKEGDMNDFAYDAIELFTGVSVVDRKIHLDWLLGTYTAPFVGITMSKFISDLLD